MNHFEDCPIDKCSCDLKRYKKVLYISLATFLLEVAGGFISNSLALLSDAAHVLIDNLAVVLAVATEYLTVRKKNFEPGKIRGVSGIISSLLLIFAIILIVSEAAERIYKPTEVLAIPFIVVAIIGFFGNLWAAYILEKAEHHLTQRALLRHIVSDAVQSIFIIVVGFTVYFSKIYILDPITSILIAFIMLIWVWKTIKESLEEMKISRPKSH